MGEKEDEEVFELAKCLLLDCATPDAMVRLKYSDLAKQDVLKLQRIYFQQRHRSLEDFLQYHLNSSQSSSRFFEVHCKWGLFFFRFSSPLCLQFCLLSDSVQMTTFSSLVTRSDIRLMAQALQLDTEKILLLSLHQFDTEASFCNKIR